MADERGVAKRTPEMVEKAKMYWEMGWKKTKICEELGIGAGECSDDGMFSVEACRCIGACGLAPVLTVNDEVYGKLVADDVPGILAKYRA